MTSPGVTSETGRLQTVVLHRPGAELERLTPRNNDELLFDGLPWVPRAKQEHDAFAELLHGHGVEVLMLGEMLVESLADPAARREAVGHSLEPLGIDDALRTDLQQYLAGLGAAELAHVLAAGLRNDEFAGRQSLVAAIQPADAFLLDPVPNLFFTRDSSFWTGSTAVVTALATPARRRESLITSLVLHHHPRFAGSAVLQADPRHPVEGGDVLVLGEGVLAVGIGQRTSASGAQQLASQLFAAGAARTVLAVPIPTGRATMHLDTVCTMVSPDLLLGHPTLAPRLQAWPLTPGGAGDPVARIGDPKPFLDAACEALGRSLHWVATTMDPVVAEREQWDDAFNSLALAPGVVVAYERNVNTIDALRRAGIEVLTIAGSELGAGRGGPRCMSCPVAREVI